MSYRYLLDLYDVLDNKINALEGMPAGKDQPPSYQEGRLECLKSFKSFLREQYHSQLPRRIRTTLDNEEQTRSSE